MKLKFKRKNDRRIVCGLEKGSQGMWVCSVVSVVGVVSVFRREDGWGVAKRRWASFFSSSLDILIANSRTPLMNWLATNGSTSTLLTTLVTFEAQVRVLPWWAFIALLAANDLWPLIECWIGPLIDPSRLKWYYTIN